MSEPRQPLPHHPASLEAKVKELLAQSRSYQEEMVRIHEALQRLQIQLAGLARNSPRERGEE
jgi:hypothetical protein